MFLRLPYVTDTSFLSSFACGIEVPGSDNILITGGVSGGSDVSRVLMYSTIGTTNPLPNLLQPRRFHGCGYYYNNNQVVSGKL